MKIQILQAQELIEHGRAVAVPTDTVYGVATRLDNTAMLMSLKGREKGKTLPILASSLEDLLPLLSEPLPTEVRQIAQQYWPGALTLVLPAVADLPPCVLAADNTIGVRVPACEPLLKLLQLTGPLAVSSANLSGQSPATSVERVEEIFGTDFPVLEGEVIGSTTPSTVARWSGEKWEILRQGVVGLTPDCDL